MNISKKNSFVFSANEKKFSNCSLKKEQIDGRLLSINSKFLAILTKNRGEIVIVDPSTPCNIKENKNINRIKSNNYGQILGIEFSPHNSNILASANQYYLLFWKIPDENYNNITIEQCQMHHEHNNKINYISFNPVVKDIICTSDLNNEIFVWNDEKLESYNKFQLDENASMIEWNPKGDLIGVTTKKQYINIIDSREKNIIFKKQINTGHFTPKFVWVDDNSFAVIGSSINDKSQKMLKLWDIRKIKEGETDNGEKASINIEKTKYINSTPFINRELKLIYIFKALSPMIDVFNYSEGDFEREAYDINLEPSFSLLINKNMLDPNKNEIDRFVICSKDNIYYESVFSSHDHHLKNIDNNVSFLSDNEDNILNDANQSINEENLENENHENLDDKKDNIENIKEIKDNNNNEIEIENENLKEIKYENNNENNDENDLVNYKDIMDENIEENKNEIKDGNINEIKDENNNRIKDDNNNENKDGNIKENNNEKKDKIINEINDDINEDNNNEIKDGNNNENNNVIEESKELNEVKLEEQNNNDIKTDSNNQHKLNNINTLEGESSINQTLEGDKIENEEIINNILDENELLGNENDKLRKKNKKYLKVKEDYNLKAKEC